MDILFEKILGYEEVLNQISERRDLWLNDTKNKIFSTLIEIKKVKELDWSVQKVEIIQNLQTVNIIFNRTPSGIVQRDDNGLEHFEKYGGGLFFSQSYNGNIFVFLEYPYVKGWVEKTEVKLLDKTSPEKISEVYIIDKVGTFLDEMIKWESSAHSARLGFK